MTDCGGNPPPGGQLRGSIKRFARSGGKEIPIPYLEALNDRGNVLASLKRYSEAVESFDQVIDFDRNLAGAHYNRGNALYALKRREEALAAYDRALSIKPDLLDTIYNRATILSDMNRFGEAIASFDRALTIKPDDEQAIVNRAMAD